jgi:hypothetical protein
MKSSFMAMAVGLSTVMFGNCGSSGGGNCGAVAPCGGDIVGDWTIVDTCLAITRASPLADCPSATYDTSGLKATGTVSYRADLTYSTDLTLAGTMALNIPESCLTIQGITLTCAQLDQSVKQALMDDPDPSIQSVSCAGSGSCTCTFVTTPQSSSSTGTYITSGNNVTENGGTPNGYCVQGSELHVSEMSMSMGGSAIRGGFVLRK